MQAKIRSGNLNGRDDLEGLGADETEVLKWILKK
jgi:hypothetical protein